MLKTKMSDIVVPETERSSHDELEPGRTEMSSIGSLTLCIHNLRSPDGRERDEAARIIWERFASRLQSLVRRHLDNRVRRREDEQDILQSMYSSFCIGQLEGKTAPTSRSELWKLLVRITMCKVVNTAHRHLAARRDVRRETSMPRDRSSGGSLFPQWMLEHVDRAQASPEEKVLVLEELNRLLEGLSEDQRQIVLWKLDGFTNAEIAVSIRRTVRSVELKMQLIRKRLQLEVDKHKPSSAAADPE
jgi:RNA polymerase sigma-70 factor (ECF subfamily)